MVYQEDAGMSSDEDNDALKDVPDGLGRAYTPIREQTCKYEDLRGHDTGYKPNKRKKITKSQLSAQVIEDIIEAATVHKQSQAHIST